MQLRIAVSLFILSTLSIGLQACNVCEVGDVEECSCSDGGASDSTFSI